MKYTKEQIQEWAKQGQAISPSVVLELMEYYESLIDELKHQEYIEKVCTQNEKEHFHQ